MPGYVLRAPNYWTEEFDDCDCRDWIMADFYSEIVRVSRINLRKRGAFSL